MDRRNQVEIDSRWSGGNEDDTRKYAEELVALAPDVIFTSGSAAVEPLRRATRTVPIVFAIAPDPAIWRAATLTCGAEVKLPAATRSRSRAGPGSLLSPDAAEGYTWDAFGADIVRRHQRAFPSRPYLIVNKRKPDDDDPNPVTGWMGQ